MSEDDICEQCVEHVARELHRHTISHWGLALAILPMWADQGEPVRDTYRKEARAALMALHASEHHTHAKR